MNGFFGKYRGEVANNVDPNLQGRIQVRVPSVLGENTQSWAMPCAPYAGPGVGFFAVPPVGANVWVEFEGGDPDHPIWTGGFWGRGEAPATVPGDLVKVLKTDTATVTLDDTPGVGGVTIETSLGMKIEIKATGMTITNGTGAQVELQGPKVSVNSGAFDVI